MDLADGAKRLDRGGRHQPDARRCDGGPVQCDADPTHADCHHARHQTSWRIGQHRDGHASEIWSGAVTSKKGLEMFSREGSWATRARVRRARVAKLPSRLNKEEK